MKERLDSEFNDSLWQTIAVAKIYSAQCLLQVSGWGLPHNLYSMFHWDCSGDDGQWQLVQRYVYVTWNVQSL